MLEAVEYIGWLWDTETVEAGVMDDMGVTADLSEDGEWVFNDGAAVTNCSSC